MMLSFNTALKSWFPFLDTVFKERANSNLIYCVTPVKSRGR